jgi:hypothetical protein
MDSPRCRNCSTGMLAHVTTMFSTVVWSWLNVLWVVDHSWYTLDTHRAKNPAALQFLIQTGVPGTYYHTPFKGTEIFWLAHSPSEWHTYTILSPLFHLHSFEVDLTSDINTGSLLSPGFTWSVCHGKSRCSKCFVYLVYISTLNFQWQTFLRNVNFQNILLLFSQRMNMLMVLQIM